MTKKKSRASIARNNKRKGSVAERKYRNRFKEETRFDKVRTTRQASRILDDCGIDLAFLPLNVQIKRGKQRGLNASKEIDYIAERMKEILPPDYPNQNYPTIVIHDKECKPGEKHKPSDELVSMTFNDFLKFFKPYADNLYNTTES